MYLLSVFSFVTLFFNLQEPNAYFVLESNKDIVVEGECVVITASLIVFDSNTMDLQFNNHLGEQIGKLRSSIINDNAFFHINEITNIEGKYRDRGDESYTTFKLLEIALCPFNDEDIEIPSQSLMLTMNSSDSIIFNSEPFKVTVNPLEQKSKIGLYQNLNYSMVGDFSLRDCIVNPKTFQVGDTIHYTINLEGVGTSFPIDIDIQDTSSFSLLKKSVERKDTIIFNELRARKSFQLYLISIKNFNSYELSNLFSWTYFSTETNQITKITSDLVISIKRKKQFTKLTKHNSMGNSIIGVDVSESMILEDYRPNRFGSATAIVNELNSKHCEYRILLFSGEIREHEGCTVGISDLHSKKKPGTAIGDLIWASLQNFKTAKGDKTLIIIGDGDETTGSISAVSAAKIAKSSKVRIYCVGIGTSDPVAYFDKEQNQFVFISNTFREDVFKEISSITNGRYVRFLKSDSPSDIKTKLGL